MMCSFKDFFEWRIFWQVLHLPRYFFWWTLLMCEFRTWIVEYCLVQNWQACHSLSTWCLLIWLSKLFFKVKYFSHLSHLWFLLASCTAFTWTLRTWGEVKVFWHDSQVYLFFSWKLVMWFLRVMKYEYTLLHNSHFTVNKLLLRWC